MPAQSIFDLKIGIQTHTVAAPEFIVGTGWVITLATAPPDPTKLIVALKGAVVPESDFTLAGAVFTYTADGLTAGDELTFIHDKRMFEGFKSLMAKAMAGGADRGEDASFIDFAVELHGWLKEVLDGALADIDARILAVVAAYNAHSHQVDEDAAGVMTTRTTTGPTPGIT